MTHPNHFLPQSNKRAKKTARSNEINDEIDAGIDDARHVTPAFPRTLRSLQFIRGGQIEYVLNHGDDVRATIHQSHERDEFLEIVFDGGGESPSRDGGAAIALAQSQLDQNENGQSHLGADHR